MKHNKDGQDQQNDQPDTEISGVDDSRRKFNKAGIIAPVLFSLSSKPVWAATCGSISGALSGNLSGGCTPPPSGFTAEEFLAAKTWPHGYNKQNTKFDEVFGKSSMGSLFGNNKRLVDVLKGEPIKLTDKVLQQLFNSKGDTNKLKDALKAYAKQSTVCALNDAIFPKYGYPGAHTFYSAISAVGSFSANSKPDKITSDSIASLISKLTADLSALKTT